MFVENSALLHLRRLSRAECRNGIPAVLGSPRSARMFRRRDPSWGPFYTDIWLLAEPPPITAPVHGSNHVRELTNRPIFTKMDTVREEFAAHYPAPSNSVA